MLSRPSVSRRCGHLAGHWCLTYGGVVRRSRSSDDVFQITGAPRALTDDVRDRQRRYLISMSIRTVCFVLAIVVSGWMRWALLVGALVLPYVAVVIANAGRERVETPSTLLNDGPAALGSGSDSTTPPRAQP
jgi:Protein of unknown function (DUF3099)